MDINELITIVKNKLLNQINIEQPLVIRLAGTNVDQGIKILKDSKIEYTEAFSLEDAANKAVEALKDLGS